MVKPEQWQWNEIQQVGTDYTDISEVENYDRRMSTFRDVEAENRSILGTLALPRGASVLEIGCGTGQFARAAARSGLQVTAVDVSPLMIEYARQKAMEDHLRNVDFHHAGFLTYDFLPLHFDAVVSSTALHHISDVWKFVALQNVHKTLKDGGQFLLRDVVFAMEKGDPNTYFKQVVESLPEAIHPEMARHIAQEYSTLDWIMEGLLQRAGFEIVKSKQEGLFYFQYHCKKDNNQEGFYNRE